MLDDLDRGVIHALHIDGRAPFSRIAAALGVSTQTVARRYRRLRAEAGLRVVGLAESRQAGQTQWMIRLTTTPATTQALAYSLARRPDTSWVKLVSGGTEIFTIVHAPHGVAVSRALLLRDIPRRAGITAVSAHCMLHSYLGGPTAWRGIAQALSDRQQAQLRPAREPATAPFPAPAAPVHDPSVASVREPAKAPPRATADAPTREPATPAGRRAPARADRDLLDALRRDGRASYAELAAATGWSQATVARHLTDLRSRGTVFFDVEIDPALLGATTQALLWMAVAPARLDHVATTLAGHPELAVVAATTGPTNLLAQALCADPAELHHYLTRRLGALDGIHTLETAPILHTIKAAGSLDPAVARTPLRSVP
ncbi:AsnC family transcriptional regulator [Actinoallomurus purpureus]|uniref:Lrp/AsnC family transcriptional regulator n=1 Tax=Actinoallomurus purpureus TaxID=478114 RepID=UPI002093289C|nr:AsnC family transcriptional regulator [Actinoallomurus purpureus]MCO6006336.1 AsnC family transcriptional regulator [Actinoallomurus purpureus]